MKLRHTYLSVWCVVLLAGLPSVAKAQGRYLWVTYRLREVSTVNNQLRKIRRVALLKLDTAKGKVWQYSTHSLTVDTAGKPGEFGHYRLIEIEGLKELLAPKSTKKKKPSSRGKKAPPPPPALEVGRFGFINISVPKPVFDGVGEKKGVIERDELFLTDRKTGVNWVLASVTETAKKDDKETKSTVRKFVRIFNADEVVLSKDDPRGVAPKKDPFKLKKSAKEWKELFATHKDKPLQASNKSKIDCVIVLSKDDSFTPLVVLRSKLKDTRAVAVTPWQVELYSDTAVDYLCNQEPVAFEDADRYAIYIISSGRTARGFNPLQTHTIGGMPDHAKIGKLLKVE